MAAKQVFTDEQVDILWRVAAQVRKKFKGQEDMALALGITQQSVANLLKRKYRPSMHVAIGLANLDGTTLSELIGDYGPQKGSGSTPPPPGASTAPPDGERFPNLTLCVSFYAKTKKWKPWTIAAARAGYFGEHDLDAPEWASRLDTLERSLEKGQR